MARLSGGKGGDVTLTADDYSKFSESQFWGANLTQPLVVDGSIRSYGFQGGGTLTLSSGSPVVIGDDASLGGATLAAGTPAAVSTRLSKPVTIPAGDKMPFAYMIVNNSTPVDTPLPKAVQPPTIAVGALVTQAPWTLPNGVYLYAEVPGGGTTSTYFYAGKTVPANSIVTTVGELPAGAIIPSSVFPNGIPVTPSVVASYTAGEGVDPSVTLPLGTTVPVGTVFDQAVSVVAALDLKSSLFQSGFTAYNITSFSGVAVASGTAINPTVPVYEFTGASYNAATGSPNRIGRNALDAPGVSGRSGQGTVHAARGGRPDTVEPLRLQPAARIFHRGRSGA